MALVPENQVRTGLPAGGNRIRTIGSAGEGPDASCVGSLSLRLFGWREPTRGDLKDWSCHAGPMVRILFPPAGSLVRTAGVPATEGGRATAERSPFHSPGSGRPSSASRANAKTKNQ